VPHKLREIDISMVKVVSTARRAVAVRCIGCGTNGQLWRGYSCWHVLKLPPMITTSTMAWTVATD